MSKRQNNITWQCFKEVLSDSFDRVENRVLYGLLWRSKTNGHLWVAKAGAECFLWQTVGAARWDSHWTEQVSYDMSRWQLCIWQDNQQLFVDKATFHSIRQIMDDRLFQLAYSTFNHVDFQRLKVRLVDCVRWWYIKFWARNIARHGKIDLPKILFEKPLLGCFFGRGYLPVWMCLVKEFELVWCL